MEAITYFFLLRLVVLVWLIVADFMFAGSLQKRNYFIVRVLIASLLSVAFALLIGYIDVQCAQSIHAHDLPFDLYFPLLNLFSHIVIYAINIAFLVFCFQEKFMTILFTCIASYSTQMVALSINNTFSGIFPSLKFLTVGTNISFPAFVFWLGCYTSTYLPIYFIFARTIKKDKSVAEFNSPFTLALFIVVLIVEVSIRSLASSFISESTVLYIYFNISVFCCCIVVLFVQFLMTKELIGRRDSDAVLHMKDLRLRQYETIKENMDIINEKCHDLKHQLLSLKNNTSIDPNYLQEIGQSIQIYDTMVNTGNGALDVVITDKKLICAKKEISMTVIADGSKISFMSDSDIYSLFGNALDNAIEYLSKVDVKNRVLKLNVSGQGNMVSISIRNYYEGAPIASEKELTTSKKDKKWHGFGVKSILKIAESYGGSCSIRSSDNCFVVSILIVK